MGALLLPLPLTLILVGQKHIAICFDLSHVDQLPDAQLLQEGLNAVPAIKEDPVALKPVGQRLINELKGQMVLGQHR